LYVDRRRKRVGLGRGGILGEAAWRGRERRSCSGWCAAAVLSGAVCGLAVVLSRAVCGLAGAAVGAGVRAGSSTCR
jgi:hypothetical protein